MNRLVKTMLRYLCVVILLAASSYLQAQVTVGDATAPKSFSILELSSRTTKGGVRLPHLTMAERNDLNSSNTQFQNEMDRDVTDPVAGVRPGLAMGLTIYNTDTNCIEYWDGYKWVSLCLGSASIELEGYPQPILPPDGGETGSLTPTEEPKCASNPPYSIAVAVGATYADAYIIEQSTGEFRVYMHPNTTAKGRTAIVRLTNNCTGEYKEFLFSQEGNTGLCNGLSTPPTLTASNGGMICGNMGNSIILAVTNPVATATYIWMRNDNEEIGRGKFITVSQAGNYKVYAGGIGCTGNDVSTPVAVTVDPAGTPPDAVTIMVDNGAVVCGGAAVTLTVSNFVVGSTVQWYKDGILLTSTGQSILTTTTNDAAGTYMAVVLDGSCTSSPSNAIVVEVKSGTAVAFTADDIDINGKSLSLGNPMFCSGGWLNMEITNVQTGYIYKWLVNGTQVGTGVTCNYQLPGGAGSGVNLSIIAESGAANSCPKAITISSTISVNEPLNAAITGANIFCNNVPGGAQLNTTPGADTYVWKNLNTGVVSNTGSLNSFGATLSGRYEVAITTAAGCLSVTSVPHQVEMIGSPALTWSGGILASVVGENQTVTFVVKNIGSPVTQGYTWTATRKSGSAGASFPSGSATNTTPIHFTGGGVVTLTIVAEGFCGTSAELTVDITVNADKPDKPSVTAPPTGDVCGGYLFTIDEGAPGMPGTIKDYEDKYGTNFIITWELDGPGLQIGTPVTSGANGRYCYVPFTGTTSGSSQVTMKATCTSQGLRSEPSLSRSARGSIGSPQTYTLKGETCFDVKQTQWPDIQCGVWAQRTPAKFNLLYTYQLDGALLPGNASELTWSLNDPNKLVKNTNFTTANKAILEFYDAAQNSNIVGSKIGLGLTLYVTFTVINGGCTATYSKSININIRDCDCCGSIADVEGNVYTAHRFGDAGCWMTENLAVTKKPNGTDIPYGGVWGYRVPGGNGNALKAKPKAQGGLSYGNHYTWYIATGGTASDTFLSGAGAVSSYIQGICPDGWVLPSDKDWSDLEEEICTHASLYSSDTDRTWLASYRDAMGWRPASDNTSGWWGQSMKSKETVAGLTNAAGASNSDGTGFQVLITGFDGGLQSQTFFWMSSATDGYYAWYRYLTNTDTRVYRFNVNNKSNAFSVRCKKKD